MASFSADVSTECDVEYVSYSSHPKLEKAREDFVKSRDEYRAFYSANKEMLEAGRKLRGQQNGLRRALAAERDRDNQLAVSALKEQCAKIDKEYRNNSSYRVVEGQRRAVSETYDRCMYTFSSYYLNCPTVIRDEYRGQKGAWGSDSCKLREDLQARLGVRLEGEAVDFYEQEEYQKWMGKR